MVQFKHAQHEIQFKIVYYGCALGGKTTNLEALHEITDPENKTELVSLKTAEDRTLFFDFLPFNLGEIQGYHIRLQAYTVPGQVHYNTTRKVVLSGADAIIFVADSQPERAHDNFVSWENMKANLLANKMVLDQIPVVIQCNKQDVEGALDEEATLAALKVSGRRTTLASALTGEGVVRTFMECTQMTLGRFVKKFKLTERGVTPEKAEDGVREIFEPFLDQKRPRIPKAPPRTPPELPKGLSEEEQLEAALESSSKLAEQYQEAHRLSRMYQDRLKETTLLYEIGRSLPGVSSVAEALQLTAELLHEANPSWVVSAFLSEDTGPSPLLTKGRDEDPLWRIDAPGAGNLALGLLQSGERKRMDKLKERLERLKASDLPDLGEAQALPLGSDDASQGFLIVYCPEEETFTQMEDRFFGLLQQIVSPRLEALALLEDLAAANERLELKVTERTADLQAALEQIKELDKLKRAFLNNVSHEMKTPLTNIRSYADLLMRYPDQREKNAEEYLGIVCDESVRLENLINDLLSFTKVKELPRGETCDLVAALDEVLQSLESGLKEKSIEVQLQKEKDVLFYEMNREDAVILFKQILDNAVKFSPEGVKIKVYLLHDPNKVIYAVRDYGPGFTKAQRENFIKPVEEEDAAVPSYSTPGFGMGLFLVREILDKYGGGIAIENMEPGSNVLVELPRKSESSNVAVSQA